MSIFSAQSSGPSTVAPERFAGFMFYFHFRDSLIVQFHFLLIRIFQGNFTILIDLSLPNDSRGPFHLYFRGIAWSASLFSPQSAFIFRDLLFHAPERITLSISYTHNKHRLTFLTLVFPSALFTKFHDFN